MPALLSYVVALAALTLAPGPLVAVLAAQAASKDTTGACALALGIGLGNLGLVLAIGLGLGFWLHAHPQIFAAAKYAGAAMLLWMALRMWRAPARCAPGPGRRGTLASCLTGLVLCLGTPQTVLKYLVLLPQVTDLAAVDAPDMLILIVVTGAVLFAVYLVVIVFAGRMQRLLRSSARERLWSRCMSFTIASSALYVFAS